MQRILALAPVVLAAAALTAGCGGSDSSETSSATEWADGVCTALSTWTSTLVSSTDSLKGGNISSDALQSTADDVKGATQTLVDDLKGLGKPDTEAGQQAKDSLDDLSSQLEQEASSIESAVDGASGASEVLSAISTVSTSLVSMGNQLSSTFSELEQLDGGGELRDAFEQAPSCQDLSSSG